ncbi:MAG: hypothetical protein EOO05_04385 [Chitinophagaceae bacterium]|nr:MAG: hypothetical protein EOO05_04385 [Chitinophagaceae bacterium]
MKLLTPILTGLIVLVTLQSCTKPRTICRGCDDPANDPSNTAIQGNLVGPDAYAGSGDCDKGAYSARHKGQFSYSFSYKVGNGRLEDFSFNHNFTFANPTLSVGTLVYKNMAYNDGAKKISILISYQIAVTEYVVIGYTPANAPIYEARKNTQTFEFVDVINTCDNTFVLDN